MWERQLEGEMEGSPGAVLAARELLCQGIMTALSSHRLRGAD